MKWIVISYVLVYLCIFAEMNMFSRKGWDLRISSLLGLRWRCDAIRTPTDGRTYSLKQLLTRETVDPEGGGGGEESVESRKARRDELRLTDSNQHSFSNANMANTHKQTCHVSAHQDQESARRLDATPLTFLTGRRIAGDLIQNKSLLFVCHGAYPFNLPV